MYIEFIETLHKYNPNLPIEVMVSWMTYINEKPIEEIHVRVHVCTNTTSKSIYHLIVDSM